MLLRRLLVALLIVVLPGPLLAPVWRLGGLGAGEDDILYYFPARVLLHEAWQSGHVPLYQDWTGLGRPYLADPQTALFYPTTWLFTVLKPLTAYPLSLWMHVSLAIWGAYRLLRSRRADFSGALFGAVAFAFCGFLLAHRAHFTMQHAAAWAPIVLWRVERFSVAGGLQRLLWASLAVGLQCLSGHVQIAAITGLGTLVFLLARDPRARSVLNGALPFVCGVGLYAVQLLPTLDWLGQTTRGERGFLGFVENSFSPVSLIGFVLPMFLGQRTPNFFGQSWWGPSHQVEQFTYIGILTVVLALGALRPGWRGEPLRRGWLVLAAFGLLLALGLYGPIAPLLYWLPGADVFRVPARALVLVHLALAALAAQTVSDLGPGLSPDRSRLRARLRDWTARPVRVALLLVAIPWLLTVLALPLLPGDTARSAWSALRPWSPAIWVPGLATLGSLWVLGLVVRRWSAPRLRHVLTAFLLADLAVIGWTLDVPRGAAGPEDVLPPPDWTPWVDRIRASQERLWVVTTRTDGAPGEYSEPLRKGVANTNILSGVRALTDYGPLQPVRLTGALRFAPWGEAPGAARLLADTRWTGPLNVGWILLCDEELPAPADCRRLAETPAGYRLFRSPYPRGRAFMADAGRPGVVRFREDGPNAFETVVDGWPPSGGSGRTARLVVARLAVPGWRAAADGVPLDVRAADGVLLSVDLPAAEQLTIRWTYVPPGLRTGATISAVTLVMLVGAAVSERLRGWRRAGQAVGQRS